MFELGRRDFIAWDTISGLLDWTSGAGYWSHLTPYKKDENEMPTFSFKHHYARMDPEMFAHGHYDIIGHCMEW